MYKSFYYIDSTGMSSVQQNTIDNNGYTQVKNVQSNIYDIITNDVIGHYTQNASLNYLSGVLPAYVSSTYTFYFSDGSITYMNNYKTYTNPPKVQTPVGDYESTVLNATGAYYSAIGNPVCIETDNDNKSRIITVLL